jgi:hypothetical protein
MHAFKLYTGADKASHLLEGELTLDQHPAAGGRRPPKAGRLGEYRGYFGGNVNCGPGAYAGGGGA